MPEQNPPPPKSSPPPPKQKPPKSPTTFIHSDSYGCPPMSISGRMVHERERTAGMTEADRIWRQKWLHDQNLSPREPILIPKTHPDLMNPIRRFYRWPLDAVFLKGLQPVIGSDAALFYRFYTGKILIGLWLTFGAFYYFKYNTNTWEKRGSWRVIQSRSAVYPGDPGYPAVNLKFKGDEYYDRGFKKSILGPEGGEN